MTAAHQAPPSLGFSRQDHWSGLPFPSPMHESEVTQSCPTLSDPMDCSPPGSSIHGIFQARVQECGAIAFSAMVAYEMPKLHNTSNQLPPGAKRGEEVVSWVQIHVCLTSFVLSLYLSLVFSFSIGSGLLI